MQNVTFSISPHITMDIKDIFKLKTIQISLYSNDYCFRNDLNQYLILNCVTFLPQIQCFAVCDALLPASDL